MTLAAALASGLVAYLAIGGLTGNLPRARPPRRSRDGGMSSRQLWLVQAGVSLTPRQFWTGSAALGTGAFGLVALATSTPAVAVVPGIAVGLLPRMWFARLRAARMRAVQEAWPDALRELVGSIAAGMSLPQALSTLARSGPDAIREAFARFDVLVRMLGVVAALEVVKAELADPTSDRVIEVLILAHERGGRIVSDLLRDLADATGDAVRTTEQITTESLEQKINARAVFVLPWLVLLLLTARPGHFRDFYQSSGGIAVVAVAALASLVGMVLVGRLAREEVEERVLVGPPAAVEDVT